MRTRSSLHNGVYIIARVVVSLTHSAFPFPVYRYYFLSGFDNPFPVYRYYFLSGFENIVLSFWVLVAFQGLKLGFVFQKCTDKCIDTIGRYSSLVSDLLHFPFLYFSINSPKGTKYMGRRETTKVEATIRDVI